MHLTATTRTAMHAAPAAPAAATDPATPRSADHGWGNMIIRRGGPDAPPAANVVAQASVELPINFGVHVRLDVSTGEQLGTFTSIDDARRAVRALQAGGDRRNIGLVQEHRNSTTTVEAVELLLADIGALADADWDQVTSSPIRFGRDANLANRFVEGLIGVDQNNRWLTQVMLAGGGSLEFEYVGDGTRRSRFNQGDA